MNKIKVLDLFAGTQSVRKALELTGKEFDYIGIDIYSPEEKNTILDLTQDDIVNKLIEVLPQGWKPDFIWASPICNKFSKVITGKNGNFYFVLENEKLRIRNNYETDGIQKHMLKRFETNNIQNEAKIALKMFDNTKDIINYFKVPFAIENPATAMSQYILKEYVKNNTNYCEYSFDYKKPTSIYTHKQLNLKQCSHKIHNRTLTNTKNQPRNKHLSYADRARVPELLIVDIFNQLFNKEQNNENK